MQPANTAISPNSLPLGINMGESSAIQPLAFHTNDVDLSKIWSMSADQSM